MLRLVPLFAMVMAGCATTPPPPRAPEPPLPRTSIAAVLERREELHLTKEQVSRLEDIESRQMTKLDELRAAMKRASESQSTNSGDGPAMGGGMGGGGRGMGGGRGGGMGGGGHPRGRPPPEVLDKIEDIDTQAFMEAIPVFSEEQKQQAVQLASNYRSQIYERRKRMHDAQ